MPGIPVFRNAPLLPTLILAPGIPNVPLMPDPERLSEKPGKTLMRLLNFISDQIIWDKDKMKRIQSAIIITIHVYRNP